MKIHNLKTTEKPDDIKLIRPFRAVVIIDANVNDEWRNNVSNWLIRSGCLYMMAWGNECSSWDDSVDAANLEEYDFNGISDDKFVLTTWHENETIEEVLWFAENCAHHTRIEIMETIVVHISDKNNINTIEDLIKTYSK